MTAPGRTAREPVHFVIGTEPVGVLFCGPTILDAPRTDRVTTDRKLVTCPKCKRRFAEEARDG